MACTSLFLLCGWVYLILYAESQYEIELLFFGLASLEISATSIVRRLIHQNPRYHAHHISERYSEFTIIAFGECIISLSHATTLKTSAFNFQAFAILCESMALLFMLWWFYFLIPFGNVMDENPKAAFRIGIGHFIIHASLAAFATGLYLIARCVNNDSDHGHSSYTNTTEPVLSTKTASFMVSGPITTFIVSLPIVAGLPPIALLRVIFVGVLELLISAFLTPLVPLEILMLLLCIPMFILLLNVIWRGGVGPHLKAEIAQRQTEKSSQVNT
ncbi:hypothetical protein THRCLA_22714 [Thraustotheca clavata]|uniref:Transmembrane protein n=1 Tax=Thraustotheca clavata TaxID=74557 RepID=A0A1V9YU36_9STRA|nr:hypothetical protein THRCLA_22714 [Thraustotheca clavata]